MKLLVLPGAVFALASDFAAANWVSDGTEWSWAFDDDSGILYHIGVPPWVGDAAIRTAARASIPELPPDPRARAKGRK